jgi:hypothetical protein
MANVATLTLKGTSDLKVIGTDLKSIATESRNAGTNLKGVTTELDKGTKSATTFGQKIKSFGSTFSSSIASIGTLGGTVLNLSRQYQDLTDSQIRVDRMQLKVSKTTEATGKAQDKLNALTAKGVTSGEQYEAALLDVKQGLEAQDLAQRNLTEAEEDHQRAQENFWIGLVPTVTSAGASVISVINDIGGTKGLGGLTSKFKELPGLASKAGGGFSGLIGSKAGMVGLLGIAAAAGGALIALQELFVIMEKGAEAKGMNDIILTGKATLTDFEAQLQTMKELKKEWGVQAETFFFSGPIGGAIKPDTTGKIADELIKGLESAISRVKAAEPLKKLVQSITSSDLTAAAKEPIIAQLQKLIAMYGNDSNWKAGYGGTAEAVAANTRGIINAGLDKVTADINSAFATKFGTIISGLTGAMKTAFLKIHPGAEFTGLTQMFAIDPVPISVGVDVLGKLAAAAIGVGKGVDAAALAKANLAKQTSTMTAKAQEAARLQAQLAQALNKTTQSIQKQAKASNDFFGHGAGLDFGGGQPQPTRTGAKMGGARNPNFRVRSDWQKATKAATGMHEMVTSPTWILAGEQGKERVDISPSGSGGGGTTIVNVYLDGDRIDQGIRYRINKNSGVVK